MSLPDSTTKAPGPCHGVRVLDLTTVISGPLCTQALGDLGADIIKVEPPGGEQARYSGPPYPEPAFSGFLTQFDRNKRSLVVDLKSRGGQELVRALAARVDVVATNFRPGVLESLGLGFDTLRERNPGLIHLEITGFGRDGPYADHPAYDMLIQGITGLMPAQGGKGPPALVQGSVADKATSLTALGGVLAALLARERDPQRRGQRVEVAMLDAYAAFALPEAMIARCFPPTTVDAASMADFFRCWATADGHVAGVVIQDRQFAGLCRALDRGELAVDPRFAGIAQRIGNYAELSRILAEELGRVTTAEFIARARAEGAPFAPVQSVEGFLADPQVSHRGTVEVREDPRFEPVRYLAPPLRFERTPAAIARHAPRLGEHSDEILREFGYDEAAIARLRAEGVIA